MPGGGLKERVLEKVDAIQDPCSLAQAIPIGLSEMGLVSEVRISKPVDAEGRRNVELVLRVTAPGCMYVPFMDRSILAAVGELDEVAEVSTDWEPNADWTPDEIAAPARERIAESRAARIREYREKADTVGARASRR
jgi:metal-sulfur cluster biosynthetic enzyme